MAREPMESSGPTPTQSVWDVDRYQNQHSFVWHYGTALIDLLNPQPGEHILDLGCGTGQLTHSLAQTGAIVSGIDSAAAMVAAAQQNYPEISFRVADARSFEVDQPLDGILSNATLHWVKPPEQVVQAMVRALKPGGRLVTEFGGKHNVSKIVGAVETVRQQTHLNPWYFPSIAEYTHILESHGLEVTVAALIDRPVPLNDGDQGLRNWLKMFGSGLLTGLTAVELETVLHQVETLLRSQMYDGSQWIADYRRLRIVAVKQHRPDATG